MSGDMSDVTRRGFFGRFRDAAVGAAAVPLVKPVAEPKQTTIAVADDASRWVEVEVSACVTHVDVRTVYPWVDRAGCFYVDDES